MVLVVLWALGDLSVRGRDTGESGPGNRPESLLLLLSLRDPLLLVVVLL